MVVERQLTVLLMVTFYRSSFVRHCKTSRFSLSQVELMLTSLQSVMRVASGLSIAGSIIILAKYIKHPSLQKKEVNKVICCVAVCDFFFSLGTLIGRPNDGTWWCWIQSASTTYFSLVSIFWTTVIAFMLYQLVHHKPTEQMRCFQSLKVHGLCWVFPLVLTFAPLSTNTYGNPSADSGWCFLDFRDGHKSWTLNFWLFTSYYAWIFVAAFLYAYMLWRNFSRLSQVYHVFSDLQTRRESATAKRIKYNVLKLTWYPIIIIVCWFPSAVYDLREAFGTDEKYFHTESSYANCIPVLKGFFTAVAFLSTARVHAPRDESERGEKRGPARMGNDSNESEEEGLGAAGLQEALLQGRLCMPEEHEEEGSVADSHCSTGSSDSGVYKESGDVLRCSLTERKQIDSAESL